MGGGLGILAVLEEELVDKLRAVTKDEFLTIYGIGRIVPSGTMTALAVAYGYKFCGMSGTVIALDPNIPPAQQRLIFEADAGNLSLRWVLDGRNLGSAARPLLWEPSPGQHTMSLVEQDRRVLDIVTFIVRDEALPPSE